MYGNGSKISVKKSKVTAIKLALMNPEKGV